MKIAVLTSDDWHHMYMIDHFSKSFDSIFSIVEPAKHQRRRILKKLKFVDYIYLLYHKYRRKLFGLDRFRKKYFAYESGGYISSSMIVNNINDLTVFTALEKYQPDFIVVSCTSILMSPILEAFDNRIINIHGGFLPNFRGNHCFFFAMYYQSFDKIGSTLHFINRGIDTGDIIEHVIPKFEGRETPESLYCKAVMSAIHRLSSIINSVHSPDSIPRSKQESKYKLYRTRDRGLTKDIIFYLRRNFGLV